MRVTYNNRKNCSIAALNDKYNDWITEPLLVQALAGFNKKKSPGPDGIKPLLFEHLPPEFLKVLTLTYKASIHLGYTPKLWKATKVIFIPKPDKSDYTDPKSFRPISLSNYFLKGLERLVVWNMDRALLQYPLHHKQHGFLSGKSTESAISNTTNYIERHIMKKQHCVGVFLDISSAFDSIKPNHVRRAMLDHGGDPDMVQWYYGYMTHRDIQILLHGETSIFSTGVGLPQGGVCSAKFWLIAFDFAIKIINTYNIEGNGYADDCSALYGGPRLDHALRRLQKMLDSLTAWGKRCGLRFNPDKSVAVVFTRRRKSPNINLRIDGRDIPFKTEVKYLGVTLDSKLYWTKHIEDRINKGKKAMHAVACITRKNWGPKPSLMRWAYLSMVRPMVTYACMIWGHRAPFIEAKLRTLNRLAINTFGTFPRSTPTRAMEIMLDILPLHLFCQQEALATRIRLNDVIDFGWDGTSKHRKTHAQSHLGAWRDSMDGIGLDPTRSDACNILNHLRFFRLNRDSFTGSSKHRTPTQFNVFTDGSRVADQTGAGYTIWTHKNEELVAESFRLPNQSSVFQAEIYAIFRAARALLQSNITGVKFVKIFVDSQAALKALVNPSITSRTVSNAVEALNELGRQTTSLTLVWIPAHRGFIGNERADELAKLGTIRGKIENVGLPKSFFRSTISEVIYKYWATEWKNTPQAQHTKLFYDGPSKIKAKYVYKLARLELGRFVRIISGHNNLNSFQTRIGLHSSEMCRFCDLHKEDFAHILHTCPRFNGFRRDIFLGCPPDNKMRWSVRDLLHFSYIPAVNSALEGAWTGGNTNNDPADTYIMDDDLRSDTSSSRDSSTDGVGATLTP